jgi:hypothetical protein
MSGFPEKYYSFFVATNFPFFFVPTQVFQSTFELSYEQKIVFKKFPRKYFAENYFLVVQLII